MPEPMIAISVWRSSGGSTTTWDRTTSATAIRNTPVAKETRRGPEQVARSRRSYRAGKATVRSRDRLSRSAPGRARRRHRRSRQTLVEPGAGATGQFELHAPRRQEIEPPLAGDRGRRINTVGPFLDNDSGNRPDVVTGGIDIVDVKRQVVPADVAVARQYCALIRCGVFEQFDVVVFADPDHRDLGPGAGIDVESPTHAVGLVVEERTIVEDQFGPEMVDEELNGLVQVRHGVRAVVHCAKGGDLRMIVNAQRKCAPWLSYRRVLRCAPGHRCALVSNGGVS